MMNVRQVCEYTNMRFDVLFKRLGAENSFQRINIGEHPNDCTGDLAEVALIKVVDNVTEALHELIDRIEPEA